jgi:hypothetical protein
MSRWRRAICRPRAKAGHDGLGAGSPLNYRFDLPAALHLLQTKGVMVAAGLVWHRDTQSAGTAPQDQARLFGGSVVMSSCTVIVAS